MCIDFKLWKEKTEKCRQEAEQFCDFDKSKDSFKCETIFYFMQNVIEDVQSFFMESNKSVGDFCFLVRNIDIVISGILFLNNNLLGVGLNKAEKSIEKCFTNKEAICEFRTLRSLILAHPFDTFYYIEKGKSETKYLENIYQYESGPLDFAIKEECDYVKELCCPKSGVSSYEPISIKKDIVPVVESIITSIDSLTKNITKQLIELKDKLLREPLCLKRDTMREYILSLNKELEKRCPYAIEKGIYENGESFYSSIVYNCQIYFDVVFKKETQEKYEEFLDYIKKELEKIEFDLQKMEFDENKYFSFLKHSFLTKKLAYQESKMKYLLKNNKKAYTNKPIPNKNVLFGIKCFYLLESDINKYIPVDNSVSSEGLYCQYMAARYFSNVQRGMDKNV